MHLNKEAQCVQYKKKTPQYYLMFLFPSVNLLDQLGHGPGLVSSRLTSRSDWPVEKLLAIFSINLVKK